MVLILLTSERIITVIFTFYTKGIYNYVCIMYVSVLRIRSLDPVSF
jgi:hypothetical protein